LNALNPAHELKIDSLRWLNRHAALGALNDKIKVAGRWRAEWFRPTKPNKRFDRSGMSLAFIENLNASLNASRPVNRGVSLLLLC
jgi:hypothetical protein